LITLADKSNLLRMIPEATSWFEVYRSNRLIKNRLGPVKTLINAPQLQQHGSNVIIPKRWKWPTNGRVGFSIWDDRVCGKEWIWL